LHFAGPVAEHHVGQPDQAQRVGLVERLDRGFGVAGAPERAGEVISSTKPRSSKSV
jgi:hypothetical protein